MANLNIRIPDNLDGRLGVLANQTGRTKSYYVREALEDKLQELEDYYLGMQIAEKVATGKMRTYSQDEVEQACGLED